MRNGEAVIVVSPCGAYPYVRIGVCYHVSGDEWELRDCRVIRRFGNGVSLSSLASEGPGKDTQLLPPSPVEYVHRLHATRVIPVSPRAHEKFKNFVATK